MKRLLALLLAAGLSFGAAACEAPGAPDAPGGGNNRDDIADEEGTDTQLDTGGGPASDTEASEADHDEHEEGDDAGEAGEDGAGDD